MSSTDHLGNGNLLVPAAVQAGGAALEPETASGRLTAPDVGRQQSAFSPQRSLQLCPGRCCWDSRRGRLQVDPGKVQRIQSVFLVAMTTSSVQTLSLFSWHVLLQSNPLNKAAGRSQTE